MHSGLFILLIAAAASSFTIITADDSSKAEEQNKVAISDDGSQEDGKDKRSQEEIMFGNQQNKPNGLVDDLMSMTDTAEEDDDDATPDKKSSPASDDQKQEETAKEEEKRSQHERDNDMMMESGNGNWFNTVPVSSSAVQYLENTPTLQSLPEDFTSSLYDQEDLYRRKRQLMDRRIPLRKRSLRSSLGQMIQKRGIRMPRRSMRLKRQVDMGDLLSLLGNDPNYADQRSVPGRFSGFPDLPHPEFRYPVNFRHRDGGILAPANDFEDNNEDTIDVDGLDDVDNLMLMPPNGGYVETPDIENLLPYRSRQEENEAIQKWLSRHTTPSVFSVSRRSAPFFYPVDYRYMPAFRKRSIFGNRFHSNAFSVDNGEEEQEPDLGKWGRVVQVPETYASPDDMARLYGLANLMAEEDETEAQKKRRAA